MPVQFDRNRIQSLWTAQNLARALRSRRAENEQRSPSARAMSSRERRDLLIVLAATALIATLAALAGFGALGML